MIVRPEHIRKVRPIAENVNDVKRLEPYIEECEKLYLIPAIGAERYKKLVDMFLRRNDDRVITDNANEPILVDDDYKKLLDGGFYDNDTKYFAGLYEALGYLVYSRFVRNQQVNATAFGMVMKQGQFSEPLDEKAIIRIANDAEKIGNKYLEDCIDFLNYSEKPTGCERPKLNSKRIKVIGD